MKIKFDNTSERDLLTKILGDSLKCPYQKQFYSIFGYKSVNDVNCFSKECSKCWEDTLEAISEVEEQEKSFTSDKKLSNEELYNAVCRELTLYEEHYSLIDRAEYLKKDICNSLEHPCNGLLDDIKYHTIQILKEFHDIWETLKWADYADEDHIEYLRDELKSLLVDIENDMYKPNNMFDVLQDVTHDMDGVYGILVSFSLKECKAEHDYYELLVFVQNNWDEILWKNIHPELFQAVEELIKEYEEDKNKFYPSESIHEMCVNDLQSRMTDAVLNIAKTLTQDAYKKIITDLEKISQTTNKPIENLYSLLLYYRDYWNELAWYDLKNDKSEPTTEPEVIRSFEGKYEFLSNAYQKELVHYGITFQNAEAAYQASKPEQRDIIRKLFSKLNAHDAKKMGQQLVIRENWDSEIEMYEVLWDKFSQSPELSAMLMATKDAVLAPEGIGTFWGIENGTGENNLGNILMQVRENLFALEEEMDVENNPKEEITSTEKTNPMQHVLDEVIHSITDYEKGVINVDLMTSAILNLAKNLETVEHARLVADVSEILEYHENVPKELYSMLKEYREKWNDLNFKKKNN